jgi:Ca2+-binding RTX toxin-like protein
MVVVVKTPYLMGGCQIGVRVNLATGEASGGDGDGDKFKNFQNLGGSEFDDYLIGDDQDNHINGESGNDEIHGGKGDDQLFGAIGEDYLYGEEGDDRLTGFVGLDHMDGGEGVDTANYHHPYATVGVKVALIEGTGIGGYAHGDTYKNIENVQGSKFNDVIRGDNQNNILYGMEGDDTIYGEEGDDIIIGGPGNNKLFGEGGDDKVILGGGSDFAVGGEGEDTISYQLSQIGVKINMSTGTASVTIIHEDIFEGFENAMGTEIADEVVGDDKDNKLFGLGGDDEIHGGKGDDTILPGAGDDTVYSEEGNDYIFGDDGNDAIDGGDGKDTVDYSKEPKEAIIIDLKKNIIKGGFAKGDKLKNIENIIGTKFDDQLTGDDNDNILSGLDGDDVIHGGTGDDILVGGSGRNQLYGEDGDDKFVIGKGENMVYGGEGYNQVSYEDSASEVTIDLTQKQGAKSTGEIDKFEDIVHADGSDYNDRIIGDDNENHLNGGDGDDYIDGGSSNDVISGGNGINTLIGGKGSDVFLALEGTNSIDGGEGIDTINYSDYLRKSYQEIVTQARLIKAGGALTSLPFDTRFITKPVISYAEAPVIGKEGLVIDLSARQIIKPGSFIDTLSSIENVVGTHYNDVITGDDENNELNGLDGDDIIRGREGNDTLVFGYGKSALYGDGGDDQFVFRDSSNDYRSIVIAGIADIYGGEGNDKLNLRSYPLAVQVNIGAEQISYSTQGSYMLQSIEHVITTDFNDEIYDSKGNDIIATGNGDDIIYLTDGNDLVDAGDGNDIIYLSGCGEKRIVGGFDRDTYVVNQDFKSVKSTIIVDFKTGIDRINLTNFKGIKGLSDIELIQVKEQELDFTIVTIAKDKEIVLFDVDISKLLENSFIFYSFKEELNQAAIDGTLRAKLLDRREGINALYLAVEDEDLDYVKAILDAAEESGLLKELLLAKCIDGNTAFNKALFENKKEIVLAIFKKLFTPSNLPILKEALLVNNDYDASPLRNLILASDGILQEAIELAVKNGVLKDLLITEGKESTALHFAIYEENTDAIELISKASDVDSFQESILLAEDAFSVTPL